jgi:hypothetical protein
VLTSRSALCQEWCKEKGFADGDTVCEGKLVLWLSQKIIKEGNLRTKRKLDAEGNPIVIPLGERSISNYISAVTELYRTQKTLGKNTYPPLRGSALKALNHVARRKERKRKIDNYHDRLADTTADGYDDRQKRRLADHFLIVGDYDSMRNRLDFLLGHAMLLRGDNRRAMQLTELFHQELKGEGEDTSASDACSKRLAASEYLFKTLFKVLHPVLC